MYIMCVCNRSKSKKNKFSYLFEYVIVIIYNIDHLNLQKSPFDRFRDLIPGQLVHQKRFYNRETNSKAFV